MELSKRQRLQTRVSRIAAALFSVMLLMPQTTAQAAAPHTDCQVQLGFAALRNLAGEDIVGSCVEDEHHDAWNGDGLQATTRGLMVWRKADNWTAFTNGTRTWIDGPDGLQVRANGEYFR